MKKKSILLTCIVAIMALAMFVGCDNAPTIPSFVVSGNIEQTGDFLTGQVFDPSKFSVTVTYDNGKIVPADSSVKVSLVEEEGREDGKVNLGDKATVTYGKNYKGDDVTDTVGISVYDITGIEIVSGPETYAFAGTGEKTIPSTLFSVSAAYLDGEKNPQTMPLNATEFKVVFDATAEPSATYPELACTAYVQPLVGIGEGKGADYAVPFAFTGVPTTPVEAAGEIVEIEGVSFKTGKGLFALTYPTIPAPVFDDLKITVKYANGVTGTLTDSEGVELTYLDGNDLPLSTSVITTGYQYGVKVVLPNGVEKVLSKALTAMTATLRVTPVVGFEGYVEGADIKDVAPDAADFVIALTNANGIYQEINADDENLKLFFNSKAVSSSTDVDSTAPVQMKDTLYVVASYMGVYGSTALTGLVAEDTTEKVEFDSTTPVTLNAGYKWPAKQYYNNITALTVDPSAVASVKVKVAAANDDSATTKEIAYADFDGAVTVAFSKSNTKLDPLTAADGDYLMGAGAKLYLAVTYTAESGASATSYVDVTDKLATDVEITSLKVESLSYTQSVEDEDVAVSKPMFGAKVAFNVIASNELGDVDREYEDFEVLVDGAEKTADAVTVTDAEQKYVVFTTLSDAGFIQTAEGTIPAGESYIAVEKLSAAQAATYTALYGQEISYDAEDYAVTGWSVVGPNKDLKPTVAVAEPAGKDLLASGNTVRLSVTYVDSTGTEKTEYVTTSEFISVANVTVTGAYAVKDVEGKIADGKIKNGEVYNKTDFTIDPSCYTPHGGITLEVESLEFGGAEPSDSITLVSTAEGTVKVNIKPFLNSNGETVKDASVTLQVVSALE